MLVSHESPICLLEKSKAYNDYQYCLVHLCEKYPEYYNHFKECISEGIEVLLDNSIFELGVAFDSDKYATIINDLKPDHYIVPDVLENGPHTISAYQSFTARYPGLVGNKIGVVQGKTFQELIDCYTFMADNCDYIAISFDYSYYQLTGIGNSKLERMCTGRQKLIDDIQDAGRWRYDKPHHLLGCSLPREFSRYSDIKYRSIRSIDTSNPIMCGIKGMKYSRWIGVSQKPVGLLADNINVNLDMSTIELIEHNISMFREIIYSNTIWN